MKQLSDTQKEKELLSSKLDDIQKILGSLGPRQQDSGTPRLTEQPTTDDGSRPDPAAVAGPCKVMSFNEPQVSGSAHTLAGKRENIGQSRTCTGPDSVQFTISMAEARAMAMLLLLRSFVLLLHLLTSTSTGELLPPNGLMDTANPRRCNLKGWLAQFEPEVNEHTQNHQRLLLSLSLMINSVQVLSRRRGEATTIW